MCVYIYIYIYIYTCIHAKFLQSCPTLCDPMDCSPPGSSVHGILQARILEWVAMPSSRGYSPARDRIQVSCSSCTAGGVLPLSHQPLSKPRIYLYLSIFLSVYLYLYHIYISIHPMGVSLRPYFPLSYSAK